MKYKKSFIVFSLIMMFIFSANNYVFAQKQIRVVTTIGQITDVVRNIGGDRVHAEGLMGAGVDPHLYRATESDVRKLSKADIIFYNGLHLEAKFAEILERMQRTKTTVAVAEGVSTNLLLEDQEYPDTHDPHIWFDITLWITAVERITETLINHDPTSRQYFEDNASAYVAKLKKLHTYVHQRADELPDQQRVLITAHDAFRYFGNQYQFKVMGLQGISTESEAGTQDVIQLADYIANNKIKAIFIESSIPTRNIQAVQEAVKSRGWDVKIGGELFSDAMGDEGTKEGTYIGMFEYNINTIVDALK